MPAELGERTVAMVKALLSGGVGLTPMVSMLEVLAARYPEMRAQFVHGTQNGATHAMGAHVRDLVVSSGGRLSAHVFYESPRPEDARGQAHDEQGLVTIAWLERNTPMGEADYYLCGPRPFLRAFVSGLAHAGVPSTRIHYEFFGPADELLAA